ncbi:hormone-sensitive lipase isoform X2 [Arctopsyche grandis]|uniref:hormone-sensitive lipase isoform X2 n=1 Tax=Arctopsyche grandis TaxID=121162 RepID=UPI00406D86C7
MSLRILATFRLLSENIKNIMAAISSITGGEMNPSSAAFCENAVPTYAMYESLKDICHNNMEYFKVDDSENGQRLHGGFMSLMTNVDVVLPLVDHVRKVVHLYDFDEKTPGNGYRSFVSVVDSSILHGVKLGRQVCIARDSLIFRKWYYTKEVEACSQLLASLCSCLHHLHTLLSWSEPGELFPSEQYSPEQLLAQTETINQYCFYGRCLGFQYQPSMRSILKGISICMAGFSEAYYSRGHIINSVWAGGKFMIDPELRARRIVNISQYADIEFCKSFWFLAESEIMQKLPNLGAATIAVNRLIAIPPEPIELTKIDGSSITIQVPDVHIGPQTLNVRLLSKVKRQGMVGEGNGGKPLSRGLLFHCHGGGFVAHTSRSHEVYLREWATLLDVPILSIDYSLAPHAPFPRAPQEVFYAYCWALKNAALLGTTAERIILAGDSAGANLNLVACLRMVAEGIRLPDGIFMAYAPMLVNFIVSPARLLCLMDPLLPFGFMMRCLKAYACPANNANGNDSEKNKQNLSISTDKDFLKLSPSQDGPNGIMGISDTSSFEEVSESDLVELQAHKSFTSDHLSDTLSGASLSSEHKTLVTPTNEDRSQQYVSDFLEKYVLESDTDSEGHKIPVLKKKSLTETGSLESATLTEGKSLTDTNTYERSIKSPPSKGIHTRLSEAAGSIVGTVSSKLSNLASSSKKSKSPDSVPANLDALIARSPSDEFVFNVPRDPYLSPYWASEDVLAKLPPVKILSVHLDPCLDDCVMFAKKIKRLGNPVTLDILEGLPHGFLSFSRICKEAHEGSLLSIKRIKELMDLDSLKPLQDEAKQNNGS